MLLVSFYGIQKYAFFFEWQTFENTDSFIIQYKNFHKKRNYGKLRKSQNNLFWSRQCMYGYKILTQYTFKEFPDFYLSGILIFSFLRPKTAIFKIFGRGESRKRPKNWKKWKNQNSAEIKVGELNKGILCENFISIHALVASE